MIGSLKKNIVLNSLRVFTTLLIPLITFPYITRILTPENLGKVNFASSIISYFLILASLGIPYYGIREIAKVRDNRYELTKVAQELLIINLFFTFISYILLFIAILIVPKFYEQKELLLLISLSILLTTVGVEWLYQALEDYLYITIRGLIFQLIYLVLVFGFIRSESDYFLYAFFLTLSTVGSNFLNLLNSRKYISYRPLPLKSYNLKRHIKPILVMATMNIAISVYVNLDIVMLGFLATNYAVGIYSVSIKLAKLSLAVVNSVGSILMARITYYIQNNNYNEIDRILSKATAFIFLTSLPIILILSAFSSEIVYLVAGSEYREASLTLKILLPIILALGLSNLIGVQILIPLGKEKLTLYSVLVGALVSFSLNLLLIPRFGKDGAAIATVIAETSVTFIQVYFAWDYMRKALFSKNILKYLLSTIILATVLLFFKSFGVESMFLNIFVFGTLSGIIYLIILILLKEEIVFEIIDILKGLLKIKKSEL